MIDAARGTTGGVTQPGQQVTSQEFAYVQENETSLTEVANRLGISEQALLVANPQINDPDQLNAGMELRMPEIGSPADALLAVPDLATDPQPGNVDSAPTKIVAEHAIAGAAIQASLQSSFASAAPNAPSNTQAGNVLHQKTGAPQTLRRNEYQRPTDHIRDMQHSINEWRAKNGKPPIPENGVFGKETETAVQEFQKSIGMSPANGVFGQATRERLAIENDSNFQALSDSTKKGIRDYLNLVGQDVSAIQTVKSMVTQAGFLGHAGIFDSAGFRSLDKTTKMNFVKELQDFANSPGKAHNLTDLVSSPGFSTLSKDTKRLLVETQIAQPDNRRLVEGLREVMGTPGFDTLTGPNRDLLVRAFADHGADPQVVDNIRTLMSNMSLFPVGANMEERLIKALAASPGGTQTVRNLLDLAQTPGFANLDPDIQQKALDMVAANFQDAPFGAAERGNLMHLLTASGFDKIKPDIRDFMIETLMARPDNIRLAEELHDLAENPKFRHEVANARKAVVEVDDRIR